LDGAQIIARNAQPSAIVIVPNEVVLFCMARQRVARVKMDGADDAVARLRESSSLTM
jgi:hypothetical protein